MLKKLVLLSNCMIFIFIMNSCECESPKANSVSTKQSMEQKSSVIKPPVEKQPKKKNTDNLVYKNEFDSANSECRKEIFTGDSMEYQHKDSREKLTSIEFSSGCEAFYIKLNHTGKLDAKIMGHNVVISTEAHMKKVLSHTSKKAAQGYLPDKSFSEVLASSHTTLGGGANDEKVDYIKVETKKFKQGESYKFFCTFPAHSMTMQGKIIVK